MSRVLEVKESVKSMKERITILGATPSRPFHVDFLNYRPPPNVQGISPLGILHHSSYPLSSFLLGDIKTNGETTSQVKCVADRGIDQILPKLKAGVIPDHAGYFECNGMEYDYRDFKIRIGVVSQANSSTKVIFVIR